MLSLDYPKQNPEFKVSLNQTEDCYGYLFFFYRNGKTFNKEANLELRHSINMLEKVFSGDFFTTKVRSGTVKELHTKYSQYTGKDRIPQNLAFILLCNYPRYFDDHDFNGKYMIMTRSQIENKVKDSVSNGYNISHNEELEIFKSFNYYEKELANAAKKILHEEYEEKSCRMNIELLINAYNNSKTFLDGIILLNQGLVYDIINTVSKKIIFLSPSDLVDVGYKSLYNAAKAFDPCRGFKFSTYAYNSIIKGFSRYLKEELRHEHQSFDAYAEPDDFIYESRAEEIMLQARLVNEIIENNLAMLDNREMEIIRKRFLFSGEKTETYESLGKDLGVSKERIRQLQNKALKKIRKTFDLEYFVRYG